jgi:hypothetical protein
MIPEIGCDNFSDTDPYLILLGVMSPIIKKNDLESMYLIKRQSEWKESGLQFTKDEFNLNYRITTKSKAAYRFLLPLTLEEVHVSGIKTGKKVIEYVKDGAMLLYRGFSFDDFIPLTEEMKNNIEKEYNDILKSLQKNK